MTMRSEFKMYFMLTGHGIDPCVITELTGIPPAETWRIGDRISETIKMKMKRDVWRISSSLPLVAPFPDHVRAVLDCVYPKRDQIVMAQEQLGLEAELLVIIYAYGGDRPGMYFEREEVAQIASLGAAIDLDLYNFP